MYSVYSRKTQAHSIKIASRSEVANLDWFRPQLYHFHCGSTQIQPERELNQPGRIEATCAAARDRETRASSESPALRHRNSFIPTL